LKKATFYTDNLIKSHFGFRRRRKKTIRSLRQSRNTNLKVCEPPPCGGDSFRFVQKAVELSCRNARRSEGRSPERGGKSSLVVFVGKSWNSFSAEPRLIAALRAAIPPSGSPPDGGQSPQKFLFIKGGRQNFSFK